MRERSVWLNNNNFEKCVKLLRGVLCRLIFLAYLGLFYRDNFTTEVFWVGGSDGIIHFVIYDIYEALLPRWYQDCQNIGFSILF